MHAQQRWNVETGRAKRCNRGSGVGGVDTNFVLPGGAPRERTYIIQDVGSLGDSLPQFGADDALVAKPEADFR